MEKNKINKTNLIMAIISLVILVVCGSFIAFKMYIKENYPLEYAEYIVEYSDKNDIDPVLVASVIRAESRYRVKAKSQVGAMGLMQVMPSTGQWIAKQIGIEYTDDSILNDPETNIRMGCWYIKYLNKQFADTNTALAAYNAGPTKVNEWLKDKQYSSDGRKLDNIPYKETENYVKKINDFYGKYEKYHGKELIK